MTTHRFTRRSAFKLSSAAVVSAAVLQGCGGESTAGSSSSAASGSAATATTEAGTTSPYLGSYTLTDAEFGTEVTTTVEGGVRTIVTNALPDTETGEFPNDGNPNTITEQDNTYTFTAEPVFVGAVTSVRTTGVAINGVKFEPGTAETITCDSGEVYRVEAIQEDVRPRARLQQRPRPARLASTTTTGSPS